MYFHKIPIPPTRRNWTKHFSESNKAKLEFVKLISDEQERKTKENTLVISVIIKFGEHLL